MSEQINTTPEPKTGSRGQLLDYTELSAFAGQMALVLRSGISALEGISIMKEDAAGEKDGEILAAIEEGILEQGSFAPALKKTGVFPPYFVNLTEIGERSGNLDSVMNALSEHYAREDAIRESTRNAVIYPLMLTGMMVAVIIVLLVRVMPVFDEVFSGLGAEMTGLPAFLLAAGQVFRSYAAVILIVIFVILITVFLIYKSNSGRAALQKLLRRLPGQKKAAHAEAACRFADAMQMTLSAGLMPDECMELAEELNEDPDFAVLLKNASESMRQGHGLAEAVTEQRLFSGIYARMLAIGQRTGTMDQVMKQIADLYEEEISSRQSRRIGRLEPLLVIVMSVVIGVILLSVMFPLLGLMSSM